MWVWVLQCVSVFQGHGRKQVSVGTQNRRRRRSDTWNDNENVLVNVADGEPKRALILIVIFCVFSPDDQLSMWRNVRV